MSDLGQFKAGETVRYMKAFNNDAGSAEDPTGSYANQIAPDGTLTALTAPAKQNAKTGLYGGTVDTTGLVAGLYHIHMGGTVTTAKTPHTVFTFRIIANTEADVMGRIGAPTGASISADLVTKPTLAQIEGSAVLAKEATVITRLPTSSYTAPDNAGIAAASTNAAAAKATIDLLQADLGDPSAESVTILSKVKDLDKGSGTIARTLSSMGADYIAKLNGVALAGVTVKAYLKTDLTHIKGQITTDAAGDGTLYISNVSGTQYVLYYEYWGSVLTKEYIVP